MISLWSSRKYDDEECTDSRPSGRRRERLVDEGSVAIYIYAVVREISSRFMITVCIWVGQSVFRPLGCNPGLSFAPVLSFAFESRIEFKSGQSNCLRCLETRNRLASIIPSPAVWISNEIQSPNRDKNFFVSFEFVSAFVGIVRFKIMRLFSNAFFSLFLWFC